MASKLRKFITLVCLSPSLLCLSGGAPLCLISAFITVHYLANCAPTVPCHTLRDKVLLRFLYHNTELVNSWNVTRTIKMCRETAEEPILKTVEKSHLKIKSLGLRLANS